MDCGVTLWLELVPATLVMVQVVEVVDLEFFF